MILIDPAKPNYRLHAWRKFLILDMPLTQIHRNATQYLDRIRGHKGTPTSVSPATDRHGHSSKALSMAGSNCGIVIADPPDGSLDVGTGNFSFGCWVRLNDVTTLNLVQHIMGKRYDGAAGAREWKMEYYNISATQSVYVTLSLPVAIAFQVGSAIVDTAWHHFLATVNRAEKIRLYRDGVLVGTSADISAQAGETLNNAMALNLGRRDAADSLNGAISNAMVWNRQLSAAEAWAVAQWYE